MSSFYLQASLGLVLLLCFIGLRGFILRFNHWKTLGIPQLEPCYVCGHRIFRKFPFKAYTECLNILYLKVRAQKLRFCGYYQFGSPLLMVVDPDLIERILVKDFSTFANHHDFRYDANHFYSHQLYSVNDAHWKTLRRQMSSMFSATSMRLIANRMGGSSEKMEKYLKKQSSSTRVNVHDFAVNFTTDLIGQALGTELGSYLNRKVLQIVTLVPSIYTMLTTFVFIFFPGLGFRFGNMSATEYAVFKAFVTANVQRRFGVKHESSSADLFQFFTDLVDNEHGIDSGEVVENRSSETAFEVKDESSAECQVIMSKPKEMMLIGQLLWTLMDAIETSSGPLSFCFHLLSLHPEHQHKIKAELEAALEKHATKTITDDVLKDLKHTEKVVKEVLRLYPAFIPLVRICTKEYKIPGSVAIIPKDTVVVIPTHSLHLDREYHSDPLKFQPDRFSEEHFSKMRPFTYLPFGNGPRGCFGVRYAMTVMKYSVASVVSKFEIKPVNMETDVVPLHPLSPILLRSREPIFVRFEARE